MYMYEGCCVHMVNKALKQGLTVKMLYLKAVPYARGVARLVWGILNIERCSRIYLYP